MNRRIFIYLSLLVVLGCNGATMEPRLEYRATRVDEQTLPLPFVVELFNAGDAPAMIGDIAVEVQAFEILLIDAVDADSRPNSLNCTVEVRQRHPTRVEPGEQGVACGFIRWRLPADAATMLAAARCVLVVDYDDDRKVESAPITLVLQSREGVLKSVLDAVGASPTAALPGSEESRQALVALASTPGEKSPSLEVLEQRLRAPR